MIPGRFYVLTNFLFGIILVSLAWPKIRQWRNHRLSSRWPTVPGRFNNGTVAKSARGTGDTAADVYELTAYFSYTANDEIYEGKYTEDFLYGSQAQQLLRSLKNGPLYVRYNPIEPWVSLLDPYRDVRPL